MTVLILWICLTAHPEACRAERILLPVGGPLVCLFGAQRYAQPWLEMHPKYFLKSWSCEEMPDGRDT